MLWFLGKWVLIIIGFISFNSLQTLDTCYDFLAVTATEMSIMKVKLHLQGVSLRPVADHKFEVTTDWAPSNQPSNCCTIQASLLLFKTGIYVSVNSMALCNNLHV